MSLLTKSILVFSIVAIFLAGLYIILNISYSNKEIRVKNLVLAQIDARDANFDKTWKTIQQQAKLADKYAKDFKDVYRGMLEGRYGEDGSQAMWQWIKEQNPTLDAGIYKTVMNTVDAQRAEFFVEQKKLISYDMEHKNLRQTFPGSWFVGNRPDVEFNIVTSTKTEEVTKTGKEDDIELF